MSRHNGPGVRTSDHPHPDSPVFLGGSARPNTRFRNLCDLAGISPKKDVATGEEQPWLLKDLHKTCATYYDEQVPESSIKILGHSVGGVTFRRYAHRAPLAFGAIMSPSAAVRIWSDGQRLRRPMSVLPSGFCRRMLTVRRAGVNAAAG